MPHNNLYLTLLNRIGELEKQGDLEKAIALLEKFFYRHQVQAGKTHSPHLKSLRDKYKAFMLLRRSKAATTIQRYWRQSKLTKRMTPYVEINANTGEQFQLLAPKQRVLNTQPTIQEWVKMLMTGVTGKLYRTQFTVKTAEFYRAYGVAKTSTNKTIAINHYKELFQNPNFIYEAMNLFLLGKITELELLLFSEVYSLLVEVGVLEAKSSNGAVELSLVDSPKININDVEKFSYLNGGRDYFPKKINSQQVQLFYMLYRHGGIEQDACLQEMLSIMIFTAGIISAPAMMESILSGRRWLNLPYPNYPHKGTVVHGDISGPYGIHFHDLQHVTMMLECVTLPSCGSLNQLSFLNLMINYLREMSSENMTAYQYYLCDIFAFKIRGSNLFHRLVFMPQENKADDPIASPYPDEIILCLCFFLENKDILGEGIKIDKNCLTIIFYPEKSTTLSFKINVIELIFKITQLPKGDGAMRILIFKKYLSCCLASDMTLQGLPPAFQNFENNIRLFRFYCCKSEKASLTRLWENFLQNSTNDQLPPKLKVIWVKFSSANVTGMPIAQFCNQNQDCAVWVKNTMMAIIASESAFQHFNQTKKLDLAHATFTLSTYTCPTPMRQAIPDWLTLLAND